MITGSAEMCRLERWLTLPMDDVCLVNSPKKEESLANAVALGALGALFTSTYAYAQGWQDEMRRYFGQTKTSENGQRYGCVF